MAIIINKEVPALNILNHKLIIYLLLVIILLPDNANADVIWPALFLESRILLLLIPIGYLLEVLVIYIILRLKLTQVLVMCFAMNIMSTFIGIILIPAIGFSLEYLVSIIPESINVIGFGSFGVANWVFNILLASIINTVIEYPVFFIPFIGEHNLEKKKILLSVFLANLLSVGVAGVSLLMFPPNYG